MNPDAIRTILQAIPDPEIPRVSIVDMGMIGEVRVEGDKVQIELIPTFAGCAAIPLMVREITERLKAHEIEAEVRVNYTASWSPERIQPEGWAALKAAGFAVPAHLTDDPADLFEDVACPKCGSTVTSLMSPFGPTACRALFKCHTCGEAFELFKPPV